MYPPFAQHFGLSEEPFGSTPDPRFLYESSAHREMWRELLAAIESGCRLQALIADPGMGKTTLLHRLMRHLHPEFAVAFLFYTRCSVDEFLAMLALQLGCEPSVEDPRDLRRIIIG
ncbi:MAG: hypothetical protein JOY79_10170, partial [Acidobacteriaceae bacterium]|nr:hypothetical protein [Acidobacteriaceae bacterium]